MTAPATDAAAPLLRRLADELDHAALHGHRRTLRPVASQGRHLVRAGRTLLNLAGNDYLALAGHPRLAQAAADAAHTHGTGATASRLISGTLELHAALEQRFARFKHAEAALLLPTGFVANEALLTTLARPGDLILQDKLNHASLIDAARHSGADVRTFPHRDLARAERLLDRHRRSHGPDDSAVFLVTDSVFSMDGDVADLPALCDLADRYDAHVIIDEAHGTGVLGPTGAGLAELQGVSERVFATVSTASKALGGLGGIITAPAIVVDAIVNGARSFIYTTAVPPPQVAAIDAALDVVADEPWRRERVLALSAELRSRLERAGWPLSAGPVDAAGDGGQAPTPIVPVVVGATAAAVALAERLLAADIAAAPIRWPTVPPNAARVRLSLRADLHDRDLDTLTDALGRP